MVAWELPANPHDKYVRVSFNAYQSTMKAVRWECEMASSQSDEAKQRYINNEERLQVVIVQREEARKHVLTHDAHARMHSRNSASTSQQRH